MYLDKDTLGDDLELGVSFEGRDFLCSQQAGCKVGTSVFAPACATGANCTVAYGDITYTLFVSKKSDSSTTPSQLFPTASSLTALQFDGVGGINQQSPSYHLILAGMNQFRSVGCESQVSIVPSSIDFGGISVESARAGATIKEEAFRIDSSKSCNSLYGLSGYLTPVAATLADGNTTLVPANNASVGVQVLDSLRLPVPFQNEFELVAPSTDLSSSTPFIARLKWMGDAAILGPFSAGATLDIFYK